MAQRFDARALQLKGSPLVLGEAPPNSDIDAETVATASRDGRLVFLNAPTLNAHFEWLDMSGHTLGALALPVGKWLELRLSPNDRYAVAANGDDLWRLDLQQMIAIRLTSNDAANFSPVWSPDGARIAFTVARKGREEIFVMNSDGTGEAQKLTTNNDLFKSPEEWTRDGLVFNSIGSETGRDIWLLPLSEGSAPIPLAKSRFGEFGSRISPDGHWIAYISAEAGTEDVYVQSFPNPGNKIRVSRVEAALPYWLPGSEELWFARASDVTMLSAPLTHRGPEIEVGEARTMFRLPADFVGMDLAHDGKRALVIVPDAGGQEGKLRVILDWTALIRR
jgi:hypothetical protein